MDELLIMRDLSAEQRMLFQSEMSRERKDPTVALLLCLFLGDWVHITSIWGMSVSACCICCFSGPLYR